MKVDTTATYAVRSANGKANGSATFNFSSTNGIVDPSSVKPAQ